MKRLFVLGNGFDIAHGISSKYSDFGKYLEMHHWRFYDHISTAFQQEGRLWVQFESILPECGFFIEESGLEMGREMFEELDYDPCNDSGIGFWLRDQYEFIKQLPLVLRDWVQQIDVKKAPLFGFNNNDLFFSFNYTDTLEVVYHIENVLHIHGDVGKKDLLIMGHGDSRSIELAKNNLLKAENDCIEYAQSTYAAVIKYLESTYKDTARILERHKTWFDHLNGIEEVYIIGHSLGDMDLPYLERICSCIGDGAQWFLCYHDMRKIVYERKLSSVGITKIKSINQRLLYL